MNKLIVHTDGGSRGNPGHGAVGAIIKSENGEILKSISQTIGQTTNNVAEYKAVIAALEWIKNNKEQITNNKELMAQFYLDSKLVVNQLNGYFKIKDSKLRDLLVQIRQLEQAVGGNVMYTLIPREKNREADRLVNVALDSSE